MPRITIISPAGAIDPALIDGAATRLTALGAEVTVAPHARGAYGRFAATEEERLSDINSALRSDADYLLCARGGYGVAQIIDSVNVSEQTPVIVGFSDITALHCLMGHCGRVSVHGSMCKAFTAEPDSEEGRSAASLWRLMLGEKPSYSLPAHPLNICGSASGKLRGGNLSLIYSLQSTPYSCPVQEGDILFIEDVGEHPYAIDRMMQNLRLSGMLAKLGGLVVGQFSDTEEDPRMPWTIYEGIRRMAEPYDYPILFDFPAGHVDRNMPLLMNAACRLTVGEDGATLSF